MDGGLRFPGHHDALESSISGLHKPRSKTDRTYFLPGMMQKSKVQRQLTQRLKKDKSVESHYFPKSKNLREGFSFQKNKQTKNRFCQNSATFCLNKVLLNLIFTTLFCFFPSKIEKVSV